MLTIQTSSLTLRVQGLSYESVNLLTGEVALCGFDLLTVNGAIRFDSLEELRDLPDSPTVAKIERALAAQVQNVADAERKELGRLRSWLRSL